MSKHTPSPWNAEKKNIHTGCVATCHWDGQDWWEVWSPNWAAGGSAEANARLIAAAPDLLNALSVLVDVAESRGIPCDAARAAIVKAKGESNVD